MTPDEGERRSRRWSRQRIELPVKIVDDAGGVAGEIVFDTGDLSIGGAFLRSSLLLELDEPVDLEFALPTGEVVRARGRVVRVVTTGEATGMGIAFAELADHDRAVIRTFLSQAMTEADHV